MAAPPKAREGTIATSGARPIVAGVAPFVRELGSRATVGDLWASTEALTFGGTALERVQRRTGVVLDAEARRRYSSYVGQARQYFAACKLVEPVAKPLLAYYFALNLAKAWMTIRDPPSTEGKLRHGLADAKEEKSRYFFQQEGTRVHEAGVLRKLAEGTGAGFCYAKDHRLSIVKLLPYLPDAYDLYADVSEEAPRLLPISDVRVLFSKGEAWLRVEIDRNVLRQRSLGPDIPAKRARIFREEFRLVASDEPTASYESVATLQYGKRRLDVLPALCGAFERTLIALRRAAPGCPRYVVLSDRRQLLSHEAVTFATLHHLSTMVRYRPQHVERLRETQFFWLFTGWVDRACESLLLSLASRITGEEHVVS